MKTIWSYDYLWNKLKSGQLVHEWRNEKLRHFREITGVNWSATHSRGKYIFYPALVATKTKMNDDPELIQKFKEAWKQTKSSLGLTSYLAIHKASSMDLATVLSVALYLIRQQQISPHVDRAGRNVYFAWRNK